MAARDPSKGQRGSKRRAQCKSLSKKLTSTPRQRARVEIGCAIKGWRLLKEEQGLRTDSEVALHLLNEMKRFPSKSGSSGASDKKIKFSQTELQTLIQLEVEKAVKKNETKLERLAASIQVLGCAVDYESSIQKLEARVKKVTERSEAAIANMTQKKSQHVNNTHSGDETMETVSQIDKESTDWMDMGQDVFQIMKTTKKELKKMRADHEALKASIVDLSEDLPLRFRPHGSSDSMGSLRFIKTEPEENENKVMEPKSVRVKEEGFSHDNRISPEHAGSEQVKSTRIVHDSPLASQVDVDAVWTHCEDETKSSPSTCQLLPHVSPVTQGKELPQLKQPLSIKQECVSHADGNSPLHADSDQDKLPYPPLPATTFPSSMSFEAALYSMPQRVKVHLAVIRQPPRLSVLWNIEKEDPSAPPMDSYSVYRATENVQGSGVFSCWKNMGEVQAIALPMCVMTRYEPGLAICVAVVGKDKFGRFGPYSEVVTAVLPD